MTVSSKKSGGDGGYYVSCMTADGTVAVDDYYTGSAKEPPGIWYIGKDINGSRQTDLGIVDGKAFTPENHDIQRFTDLVRGFHPEGGHGLVQNAGSKERVAFIDFCLSPPKSMGLCWGLSTGPLKAKIENVQLQGARTFLDFMSTKSISRQGKGGVERTLAPLRAATFSHGSSREDDPQPHTHCVVFNHCQRPDGTTGALETRLMFKYQGAAASLYHADVAWGMRKLQFGIEIKGNLFEVKGVPSEVLKAFSQRREQIVKAVEKQMSKMGLDPDAAKASRGLLQKATTETRLAKNQLTREQLTALWVDRGAKLGFTEIEVRALMNEGPVVELTKKELLEAARETVAKLTETSAVFKEPALITRIAIELVGRASPQQILETVEAIKPELLQTLSSNRIAGKVQRDELTGEPQLLYTTREWVVLERQMLALAVRMDGAHILKDVVLSDKLSPEQREAAIAATTDVNSVTVIEGAAGAGKTFVMKEISRAYVDAGYKVTGLSGSWSAALNLAKEAELSEKGRAITGWALDVANGNITLGNRDLIIIDEAGMVGARQMKLVLEIAEKAGAKVIPLGDTKQQQSVASGPALRVITAEIGSKHLNVIRRQHRMEDRVAVAEFFDGHAKEGLAPHIARGAVHITQGEEATHAKMVADWQASHSRKKGDEVQFHRDGEDLKGVIDRVDGDKWHVRTATGEMYEVLNTHLMIAVDKVSVSELNRLAHEARRDAGELGKGQLFHTMDCKTAEDRIEFSEGDRVVFRKNASELDVYNRQQGYIESIHGEFINVRTDDGRLITMDPTSEKWQFEGKEEGFGLQHAYATTVYSSQGLTVGSVFLKDSLSLNRANAGVGMSRHKEDVQAYVDKQVRYESKMQSTNADEWHHIDRFSNEECLARIATAWSSDHGKDSTMDFTSWQTAVGAQVDLKAEVAIANVCAARELANTEIARIQQSSKQPVLRDVTPRQAFGFQQSKEYQLQEPKVSQEIIQAGLDHLEDNAIEREIAEEAVEQGFLSFDKQGLPVFYGRRPGDSAVVNIVSEQQQSAIQKDELRNRYPPILLGDPKRVDVVKTGQDALALWSLQDKTNMARSTVIVSAGKEEALALQHVRDKVEKADQVKRHAGSFEAKPEKAKQQEFKAEKITSKDVASVAVKKEESVKAEKTSIVDVNQAAAEAAARAAAEAASRAAVKSL